MVIRSFLKMNNDDRKSALDDFKSFRFITTTGFILIGAFLTHIGFLIAIRIIEVIGIVFFALGGILSVTYMWNKSKTKSVILLAIIALPLWFMLN